MATRERHSSSRSSGREEIGGVETVVVVVGIMVLMAMVVSLGKHDFISQEKWRELQLSDIFDAGGFGGVF